MAGRWRDPSAFRADPAAAPAARPTSRQTVALLAVLLLVAGAVALASYLVRPDRARAFSLFHGSLFLADQSAPTAVDLATGKPTMRLVGVNKQVGITGDDKLDVVPLEGGTLLVNSRSGEFNMVDSSGFVIKHDGGGVRLGNVSGDTSAIGVASHDLAYIVRNSTDRTDVFLVSQATVTAAIGATGAVTPRASTATTDGPVSTGPGGAVSANHALWALVETAPDVHVVRRFDYPADSNPGVRLSTRDAGRVSGPVALGVATGTGSGTNPVAVADSSSIRILTPTQRTVPFTAPAGVTEVLPATSTTGRFDFLLRVADGWQLVSVGADGSGLEGPHPLAGLPPDPMAEPAYSAGALYTLDQRIGVTYRIGPDGSVTAIANYPLAKFRNASAELPATPDGYLTARGDRVVVNDPAHANALMVFTDGSHPPLPIVKSNAVDVSAAGGAEQLTRTTVKTVQPPHQTGGGSKPRQTPVQIVNPRLDCGEVTQKPHVPIIGAIQPGSRAVTVNWTYPIIDRTQDCFPTTYVIEIRSLSPNAPKPPSTFRVDAQVAATITGLFPQTLYEMRVTAYINEEGTSSPWFQVQTGAEGPAAPTNLTVNADAAGNWILDWDSCGDVQAGCVPVQSWTVTPSFCDGRGLGAPPAALTAPADPTTRRQPAFRYPGSDALLGRGLQFVVTGSGTSQVPGTPSARTPCITSWTAPTGAGMTLSASKPANSALGATTSTTATLTVAGDVTRAFGGVGAQIKFTLTGPEGSRTATQTYDGAGSSFTTTFTGLRPGVDYQASVTVSAPGHPTAAVTVGPVTVTAAADWPALGLSASCAPEGDVVQLTCAFTATISGITSAAVNGETFDIVDTNDTQSGIRCGNSFRSLARTGIDPAQPITDDLNLLSYNGTCTVTLVLRENGPVFGGTLKVLSTQYTVGGPTTYQAKASDWAVRWDPAQTTSSQALVTYQGDTYTAAQLRQITQNWTLTVRGPDGQACGSWSGSNPPDGVDVPATGSCVNSFGDRGGWSVDIAYQDVGTGSPHTVPGNHNLNGPPPTYQPCTPTDFAATWGGTAAAPEVDLTVGGQLAGCGGWKYDVQDPSGTSCPASSAGSPDSVTLTLNCTTAPSSDPPWTVHVTWTDPAGNAEAKDITVSGDPPQ